MGLIILLFTIGALLLCVGIVIYYECRYGIWEPFIIFGVAILFTGLIIYSIAGHKNAFKELNTEKYMLEYKILSEQYNENNYNEFTYTGRKALMDDILAYNQKIISGRAKHNSEWIGVLYPEEYDSLPLIELKWMEE